MPQKSPRSLVSTMCLIIGLGAWEMCNLLVGGGIEDQQLTHIMDTGPPSLIAICVTVHTTL